MRTLQPLLKPSLEGATEWLNTAPLALDELRGRVVLVDFWTFTCINWLRQLPHVSAWSRAYRDDGLVVIGVHTPEFSFEHSKDRVQRASDVLAIDYPVAIDNDYAIWRSFANHYWPALYFLDTEGHLRDFHYGEGRYPQSERVIQKLLGVDRELAPVVASGVQAAAAWPSLRATETYLGYERSERFASPGGTVFDQHRSFAAPDRLRSDRWALSGEWAIHRDHVALVHAGGSIRYRFNARDAHLVMARAGPEPIPFRISLDGEAPGSSHGADTDAEGNGLLDESRLYQLVRQSGTVRKRLLEITFLQPGALGYAFSFG